MSEVVLKPIREVKDDYDEIEALIKKLFLDEIYVPLMEAASHPEPASIQNAASDALMDAIKSGRIWFYRGYFKGKLNAAITKALRAIGAKWDRKSESFKILLSDLPPEFRNQILVSENRFNRTLQKVQAKLDELSPEKISESFKGNKLFSSTIYKVDQLMKESVKGITILPKLTDHQREKIAEEYTQNMRRYIKGWTEKEIVKLRVEMQKSAFEGYRYETMIKKIQKSYDVSENKAKFLARQETNLLMAKFKETRYQSAGINVYIWTCVVGTKDHPVRPMHKKLDGKRFAFDNPPVVDEKGAKKNPGEDYNCRCTARPVVKF